MLWIQIRLFFLNSFIDSEKGTVEDKISWNPFHKNIVYHSCMWLTTVNAQFNIIIFIYIYVYKQRKKKDWTAENYTYISYLYTIYISPFHLMIDSNKNRLYSQSLQIMYKAEDSQIHFPSSKHDLSHHLQLAEKKTNLTPTCLG